MLQENMWWIHWPWSSALSATKVWWMWKNRMLRLPTSSYALQRWVWDWKLLRRMPSRIWIWNGRVLNLEQNRLGFASAWKIISSYFAPITMKSLHHQIFWSGSLLLWMPTTGYSAEKAKSKCPLASTTSLYSLNSDHNW
jgi:hypothetical protein